MGVVIVDYGLGNLMSLQRALEKLEVTHCVVSEHRSWDSSDLVLLPGVGAFPKAMDNIDHLQLRTAIRERAADGGPLVGICLGMQLLFDSSTEGEARVAGLSVIPGHVEAIPPSPDPSSYRVPNVGWSVVRKGFHNSAESWLDPFIVGKEFYFTHSFRAIPHDARTILGEVSLGNSQIAAVVEKDNILGFQFHPEKSGENGLRLLRAIVRRFS